MSTKRWLTALLLVVIMGGLLVYRFTRRTMVQETPTLVHEPTAHVAIRPAMRAMGYGEEAYTAFEWRSAPCDYHTYLVRPEVDTLDTFFFIRSLKTGEMKFLRGDEFDQALKKHVSYDGKFLAIPRGLGDAMNSTR